MLEIANLKKCYPAGNGACVEAVRDVSFSVGPGECVALVGPSGCGKSTLLSMIAGLRPPTSGQTTLDGLAVVAPPADMAMVFQDYGNSLFPWRTVLGNVLFGLEEKRIPKKERRERAMDALESVGLAEFAERRPWQLSGGMQQRAAIARGLAYGARILLMDEPFASVDAQTREDLEDLLLRVRERYATTVLFVTHDIDEAVYLSGRTVVLSARPSTVMAVIEVDLPWPREQTATRSAPRFIELRNAVHRLLKNGSRPA